KVRVKPVSASSTSGASPLALARRSMRLARVMPLPNASRKRSSWFTLEGYPSTPARKPGALREVDAVDVVALGDGSQDRAEVAVGLGLEVRLDDEALLAAPHRQRSHVEALHLVQERHHPARVGVLVQVDDRCLQLAGQLTAHPAARRS